ncbi:hypothetical protein HWV62_9821 [Athelia sp. TMB]|nr:hypothetical protein HWV62_9821 [Athelia sp. TMB]
MKKLRGGHVVLAVVSHDRGPKITQVEFKKKTRKGRRPTYKMANVSSTRRDSTPPTPTPSVPPEEAPIADDALLDFYVGETPDETQEDGEAEAYDPDVPLPRRATTAHDHLREWKETYQDIYMPVYLQQAGRRNTYCSGQCSGSNLASIRFVYKRQIVNDGNFKAQNSHSTRPDQDVCLYDGEGYMVAEKPYQEYLAKVPSKKERSTCRNHKAQNSAERKPRNLRASGIAACACARHGCFVPNSVVDFHAGEQQRNVDYSKTRAHSYRTEGLQGALDIYDINCQYCKKFWHRVLARPEDLSLPEHINEETLIFAVGSFHLSAHVPECFSEFSLHFVKGIGNIDGEILETLWAEFNNISPMCRPMTASQRREIYDDFMRDSNWKKMVNIVKTLLKKCKRAEDGLKETKQAFERLNEGLSSELVAKWELAEKQAAEKRGKSLKCYDVRRVKAATMSEIQMEFLNGTRGENVQEEAVSWLASGIAIEAAQDKFSTDARRLLGVHATIPAKTAFAHRQSRLKARVRRFQQAAMDMYRVDEEKQLRLRLGREDLGRTNMDLDKDGWGELIDMELTSDPTDTAYDGEDDEDRLDPAQSDIRPDRSVLLMPSEISPLVISKLNLTHLADLELEMRKGQANDSLEGLMLALCTQGLLLRTKVRNAQGTKTKTRAFNEVTKVRREVEEHVRSYRRARKAILALSIDPEMPREYQPITTEDLKTQDVTDERRLGQSRDTLAWFWKLGAATADKSEWTEEFYRVSWLRAKARMDRWWEEGVIVSHEMLFVILFHKQEAEVWRSWAEQTEGSEGSSAFAFAKMEVAERRAADAEKSFAGKVLEPNWDTV